MSETGISDGHEMAEVGADFSPWRPAMLYATRFLHGATALDRRRDRVATRRDPGSHLKLPRTKSRSGDLLLSHPIDKTGI
ncbi:hypothetical protein [Sphingobium sp. TCM1]|uniref:hypothetical protein n=1 Tax=Sphingobium sp. TCM1 TaxID=453246 RepID=UPI0012EDEAAB|nr:hypothetical protein [Sphingobium sp. TCM1]